MGVLPARDSHLESVGVRRDRWLTGRLLAALAGGLAVALAGGLLAGAPALAHRFGRPVPEVRVLTQPTEQITWLVSVRLLDQDSREPIRHATVRVTPSMAEPHRMILPTLTFEESPYVPGLYAGAVTFLHPARWTLDVEVSGPVVPVRKTLEVHVTGQAGAGRRETLQVIATAAGVRLGGREWVNLGVLTVHLMVGAVWVSGLLIAGFVWPALRATGGAGQPPAASALRRLVAVSWIAVALLAATGVYNSLYNMPVEVDWRSGSLQRRLAQFGRVPFGAGYGMLLFAKHGVVLALLTCLTGLTVAARRLPAIAGGAGSGSQARAESIRARRLLRLAAVAGAVVLLQSAGLGYLHRLIAHF
ncbi:MAG: hypothetical protein QN168_01740 [Armatimonadota bacterium]|nr:hypothetical protein [Armatimonadota bacterium]